jgi:MYXO-CTERM domain-containing protein
MRPLLALVVALLALFSASAAHAAGRVEWKSKDLQEREDKSWRLEVAIFLAHAPDVAHVPMKFEFQPTAYFERAMLDGDKLVERMVPLENRQALIESVDVGFLDSGSGKIESRTRFSFKVTRAHGYEAGEYKVTIRDGRNGQTVGTSVTLAFKGENEIIDRRAMVFSGEKKKKKKDADDGGEKKDADKSDEKKDSGSSEGGAEKSESSSPKHDDGDDDGGGNGPEPIKKKPGGCGCRIEETAAPDYTASGAALLLGALAIARRRRSPKAA